MIGYSVGGLARRLVSQAESSPTYMTAHNYMIACRASLDEYGSLALCGVSLTLLIVWPNTLVLCALYNTLHSAKYSGIGGGDGLSRERFFTYAFVLATVWCKYRASSTERTQVTPPCRHSPWISLPSAEVSIYIAQSRWQTSTQPVAAVSSLG